MPSSTDPDGLSALLQERARRLAKAPPVQEVHPPLEVVVFHRGDEVYAVEARLVRQVAPLNALTPVPGTPAFMAGITLCEGEVLSVVDLKALLSTPAKGLAEYSRIIVLQSEEMTFALLADAVMGLEAIAPAHLQPSFSPSEAEASPYLLGLTTAGVSVLDGARLLHAPQLVIRQDPARPRPS